MDLIDAAREGDVPKVVGIISTCADANITTMQHGWTALHKAAQHGHTNVVDLLLDAGARANVATKIVSTKQYQELCNSWTSDTYTYNITELYSSKIRHYTEQLQMDTRVQLGHSSTLKQMWMQRIP